MRSFAVRGLGLLLCLAVFCTAFGIAKASDTDTPAILGMSVYALDEHSIKIHWHQSTGTEGVRIWRSRESTGILIFNLVATITVTEDGWGEWIDTDLTEGEICTYELTPFRGSLTGERSTSLGAVPLGKPNMAGIPEVMTEASGRRHARILWNAVEHADGYELWKGVDEYPLELIGYALDTTVWGHPLADDFVSSSFMTRAFVSRGAYGDERYFGPWGTHVVLEYPPVLDSIPIPSDISPLSAGGETISLHWIPSDSEDTYAIYRSMGHSLEKPLIGTAEVHEFWDTGLTTGSIYFYRIATLRDGSRSEFSDEVWAAPMYQPNITNASLSADRISGTLTITLSWTEAYREARYRVYNAPERYLEILDTEEISAAIVLPLPDGPTMFEYVVRPYVTAVDGTVAFGPKSRGRMVSYSVLGPVTDLDRYRFEGTPPWAEPWHADWLSELLDAFADADRWPREPLPGSDSLAQLANKTLNHGRLTDMEKLMDGALHPDGRDLLLCAFASPLDEGTGKKLTHLLDEVTYLLAQRTPENLGRKEFVEYKKLLDDIHSLPGMNPALLLPAKTRKPTSPPTPMPTAAPTPKPTEKPTEKPTQGPNDTPPVTKPPVTKPPVTEPPVTKPPITKPPVTEPPVTKPPVTKPPSVITPLPILTFKPPILPFPHP